MAFQLIILAVLAAVVLYQLYSVLGKRVGRQPEDMAKVDVGAPSKEVALPPLPAVEADAGLTGLAALRARDPSFDVGRFLQGAKSAYEMIVTAFAKGEREVLKRLLSEDVLAGFENAITTREAEGRTETIEFLQPPRADLEKVDVAADRARVSVRFLAELRTRSKGPEGEAVDDQRTAELWTFERNLKSRDPNWTLVHVDAAEA